MAQVEKISIKGNSSMSVAKSLDEVRTLFKETSSVIVGVSSMTLLDGLDGKLKLMSDEFTVKHSESAWRNEAGQEGIMKNVGVYIPANFTDTSGTTYSTKLYVTPSNIDLVQSCMKSPDKSFAAHTVKWSDNLVKTKKVGDETVTVGFIGKLMIGERGVVTEAPKAPANATVENK